MFRLSLCNEVLRDLTIEQQCAMAAALGYKGLEIAPFTLIDDPRAITNQQIKRVQKALSDEGLACTGLHWLLVSPEGLSITNTDTATQAATAEVLTRLCNLAGELDARVLVHGSPAQRMLPQNPDDVAAARQHALHMLQQAARSAEAAGVIYCLESLSAAQTNFVTSIEEAAEIVRTIDSPHFRTMIDCASAATESATIVELIELWMPTGLIAHVQVNDQNRRGPGQGEIQFEPILAALIQHGYRHDIAVEPFDYIPDGPTCAARSVGYLQGILENIEPNA